MITCTSSVTQMGCPSTQQELSYTTSPRHITTLGRTANHRATGGHKHANTAERQSTDSMNVEGTNNSRFIRRRRTRSHLTIAESTRSNAERDIVPSHTSKG
jgi:hypothetical protein